MQMSDKMREALTDVDYPAGKAEIMKVVKAKGVPKEEMDMMEKLPDREYSTMSEVTDEMDKIAGMAM